MSIHLKQLFRFPVKSCGGEKCKQVNLLNGRIAGDRDWSIVRSTDNGLKILTQRDEPRLCLIKPLISNNCLVLTTKNHQPITIPIQKNKVLEVKRQRKKIPDFDPVTIEKTCFAYDQGDLAAQWLSEFLGYECRLVYQDPNETNTNDLTDQGAISIIAEESRDKLAKALHEPDQSCPPMENFRPNFVISSNDGQEAFFEDKIQGLRTANAIPLTRIGPTTRCYMPEIDQETAQRVPAYRGYMQALMRIRKAQEPTLGSFFRSEQNGIIKEGEELTIIND